MLRTLHRILPIVTAYFLLANCAKWTIEPYDLKPQVQTGSATTLNATAVQIEVKVVELGPNSLQEFGIVYSSTNSQPTLKDTKVPATGNGSAAVTLNGLLPNTTYSYRAYATNNKGQTGYGEEVRTLKTGEVIAQVETLDPTGTPASTSAQVQCRVLNTSDITLKEYGIVYSSTNADPTITAADGIVKAVGSGNTTVVTLANLKPNTTYTYKAYVISNAGTNYGTQKTFKTAEATPEAETLEVVGSPASTSAQVQCQVKNTSAINLKEYGIVYSADNSNPTIADSRTGATGNGTAVTVTLNNLQAGKQYYYKAYAINSANVVGYGNPKSFTTPAVQTPNISPLTLYIPSVDGTLYAVDPSTGTINWKFVTSGQIVNNPVVANGKLYVGSNDGNLYALDPAKGTKLWSFSAGNSFATSSPVVDNNTIYIGNENGKLYAINATDGSQKWAFTTQQKIWGSPSIANGLVYVGSYDSYVYAVDASTGARKWSYLTKGSVRSSPLVSNGILYIGSQDKSVYALDAQSGSFKWSYPTGGFVDSSPTIANGVVYVGSRDRYLYALDATAGTRKWSYLTGDEIYSSPTVVPALGVVYVGSDDHKLYAINSDNGSIRWSFEGGSFMAPSPIYANGLIYAGNYDFKVYALDPFNGNRKTSFTFVSSGPIQGVPIMAINGEISGVYPTNSGAVK